MWRLFCVFLLPGVALAADSVAIGSKPLPDPVKASAPASPESKPAIPSDTTSAEKAMTAKPDSQEGIQCPGDMVGMRGRVGTFLKRDHAFCVDKYEFPNTPGKFPLNQVSWAQARQFCQERGKRLCEDREWMIACRGPSDLKYGYGKKYDKDKCVTKSKYFGKVGTRPECGNEYGVYDMLGNVSEWTLGGGIVAFGGYWKSEKSAHCGEYRAYQIDRRYDEVGFRCCKDAN